MEPSELVSIRKRLKKTQKQMAELLGVSIKAVHSYEQGWRKVPAYVERQAFFLLSRFRGSDRDLKVCWTVKKCPAEIKEKCPAWEFRSGTLCWFINGTICKGMAFSDWKEKMKVCRECEVLAPLLSEPENDTEERCARPTAMRKIEPTPGVPIPVPAPDAG